MTSICCVSNSSIPGRTRRWRRNLSRFKKAEFVWCQEEPKNMGAWTFVQPGIERVLEFVGARTRGRAMSAGRFRLDRHRPDEPPPQGTEGFLEQALG